MGNRFRRKPPPTRVTFRVGAPPPTPPRPHRPVSIWPTAMLGTLVLMACMAMWFGSQGRPARSPALTPVTPSTATP